MRHTCTFQVLHVVGTCGGKPSPAICHGHSLEVAALCHCNREQGQPATEKPGRAPITGSEGPSLRWDLSPRELGWTARMRAQDPRPAAPRSWLCLGIRGGLAKHGGQTAPVFAPFLATRHCQRPGTQAGPHSAGPWLDDPDARQSPRATYSTVKAPGLVTEKTAVPGFSEASRWLVAFVCRDLQAQPLPLCGGQDSGHAGPLLALRRLSSSFPCSLCSVLAPGG